MKKILLISLTSFVFLFLVALPAKAQSISELMALLESLQKQLAELQLKASALQNAQNNSCQSFNRDLTIGSEGDEVVSLQNFLIRGGYLVIPEGTPKGFFGSATQTALARYQSAKGISPANGYLGALARAKINTENCGTSNPDPVTENNKITPKVTSQVVVNNETYKQLKISLSGGTRTNPVHMWDVNIKCSAGINRIDTKGGIDCDGKYRFGNSTNSNGDAVMNLDVHLNADRKDGERLDYTIKALDKNNKEIGFTGGVIMVDGTVALFPVINYFQGKAADKNELFANESFTLYGSNFGKDTRVGMLVSGAKRFLEIEHVLNSNQLVFKTPSVGSISNGTYVFFAAGTNGVETSRVEVTYKNPTNNATSTTHTLSFNGNGATSGSTRTQTCTTATINGSCAVSIPTNNFARTGYMFDGWATSPTGFNEYNSGQEYSNLKGNVTLYARWKAQTATSTSTPTPTPTPTPTTTPAPAPTTTQQASVTVSKTGQGTVSSSPAGINCGSTCTKAFNKDTMLTLTATPASGHKFVGWTNHQGCTAAGTCTTILSQNRTITANFEVIPPTPTGLKVSYGAGNTEATLAWNNVHSVYLTRVTNDSRPSENKLADNRFYDFSNEYRSNTVKLSVTPGDKYTFWVHSGVSSNYSPQATITFTVPAAPTAETRTTTSIPKPTGLKVSYSADRTQATVAWDNVHSTYLTRMTNDSSPSQNTRQYSTYDFSNTHASNSKTVAVTPGDTYTFWVHSGTLPSHSASSSISFRVPRQAASNSVPFAEYSSDRALFLSVDLELGISHPNVTTLQKYLNSNGYTVEALSGQPGSAGYESDYFGEKTRQALIKFQQDKGISPAQGYFGPKTRSVMGIE